MKIKLTKWLVVLGGYILASSITAEALVCTETIVGGIRTIVCW